METEDKSGGCPVCACGTPCKENCTPQQKIVSYPEPCRLCTDKEFIFSMPGHPDDGQLMHCGIMEENKRKGCLMFYCPYFRGVMEIEGDKVKCKTNTGTCLCQPENHDGKGACGKPIAVIIDADRVQETARIERLLTQGRRYQQTGDVRSFSRPVIIAPPASSPHAYLDPVVSDDNMNRVIERLNVDQKIARASVREDL